MSFYFVTKFSILSELNLFMLEQTWDVLGHDDIDFTEKNGSSNEIHFHFSGYVNK